MDRPGGCKKGDCDDARWVLLCWACGGVHRGANASFSASDVWGWYDSSFLCSWAGANVSHSSLCRLTSLALPRGSLRSRNRNSGRCRGIADMLGDSGYKVVVPKVLEPPFEGGTDGDGELTNKPSLRGVEDNREARRKRTLRWLSFARKRESKAGFYRTFFAPRSGLPPSEAREHPYLRE